MPGSRTYEYDGVSVEVEGDLETRRGNIPIIGSEKAVYFTDQSPTFKVRIKNETGDRIYGKLNVRMAYGPDRQDAFRGKTIEVDLDDGEETVGHLDIDFLPYQDDAVIRVNSIRNLSEQQGEAGREIRTRSGMVEVYAFTVWDRDFYRVNYVIPRRSQVIAAVLAVCIIVVGVLQILLA